MSSDTLLDSSGLDRARSRQSVWLSACLTVFILATGFAGFITYRHFHRVEYLSADPHTDPFWGPYAINTYFARVIEMFDSSAQRFAFRVDLAALTVLLFVASYSTLPSGKLSSVPWEKAGKVFVAGGALAVYTYCLKNRPIGLPQVEACLGSLAIAVCAIWTRPAHRNRIALFGLILLVLAADVPGFFAKLDLSRLDNFQIILMEHHYSVVLGQAERLAAGQHLGELVTPRYGLLLHLSLAAWQQNIRPLSVGEVVWVLQAIQLVYLLCCLLVFARYSHRKYVLCIVGMLLVLPWYYFSNYALIDPNESAWRTLGFPIALLSVQLVHRRSSVSCSFILGVVSGFLLLLNLEAGIAATAGLCAYLIYRTHFFDADRRFRNLLPMLLFLPGILTSVVCFELAWRLSLGYWLHPSIFKTMVTHLAFWSSSGFAGMAYPRDVMPAALLAGSMFILLRVAFARITTMSLDNAVRITAAATVLVWLPYYVNRPAFWNLSGFAVLFGLIAIDGFRWLVVGVRRRQWTSFATVSSLAVTGLVTIPFIKDAVRFNLQNSEGIQVNWRFSSSARRQDPNSEEVSGVIVRQDIARAITQKANALQQLRSEPVVFLTLHSYLIPKVAGVYSQIPIGDLVGENLDRADYEQFVNYLLMSSAKEIYVDPPSKETPVTTGTRHFRSERYYFEFYEKLLSDLSSTYRRDRTTGGWEVWIRRS
jgi:hypothetical protein